MCVTWPGKLLIFVGKVKGSLVTYCGLATQGGVIKLGQRWFRRWLVAWRHQAINWTNVDSLSKSSIYIHLRAISQEKSQPSTAKRHWKFLIKNWLKHLSHWVNVGDIFDVAESFEINVGDSDKTSLIFINWFISTFWWINNTCAWNMRAKQFLRNWFDLLKLCPAVILNVTASLCIRVL